ncbi:RNase adapter RapZ [Haliea sp. AH-315-K21]|uniref:RNase adapter RapZ n=1 Tax=SAR86 cluster bacterium TaxID=2030880 RepID=A0A2A5CAT8_9GAMM|nr:RNase adapter RapZ [Haliea sp. AH-315-K21]PCJ40618.1 MAG: RNase adapter RapZ [SAR86 cluster bacterium]
MKLIIISGRSGSGKSTCLHVLEDLGYYCVDNMPASLLAALAERIAEENNNELDKVAVSIDARNLSDDLSKFREIFARLDASTLDRQIIFLDAETNTLLKRFSETRRKHPLSNTNLGLLEAIKLEKELLSPIANLASLTIDTSSLTLHDLRDIVRDRVANHQPNSLALQFQSFGFKHGIPIDADMVYDVRCLPNPYWVNTLRGLTGLDQEVISFLAAEPEVEEMYNDIKDFLGKWIPSFERNNRSYITIALGCTGGQHRSVFLSEKLREHFSQTISNIQVRHRELSKI